MAINEACQVWIEQRIEEELQDKEADDRSIRSIGKTIASEIYRHFEVRINPDTIRKRVERKAGTFVPPATTPDPSNEIQENQKPTPRKHVATGEKPPGGSRTGSGRRPGATDAMSIAKQIIRLLKKIRPDDPMREEAIVAIENCITELDGLPSVDDIEEEEVYL